MTYFYQTLWALSDIFADLCVLNASFYLAAFKQCGHRLTGETKSQLIFSKFPMCWYGTLRLKSFWDYKRHSFIDAICRTCHRPNVAVVVPRIRRRLPRLSTGYREVTRPPFRMAQTILCLGLNTGLRHTWPGRRRPTWLNEVIRDKAENVLRAEWCKDFQTI